MPDVSHTTDIPASPEQVQAVAGDFSRYGEWNQVHDGFPDGTPTLEQGATFREKVTIMGMPGEATWKVTEYEPAHRIVLDGDGPMGIKLGSRLEIEPQDGGSRVTMHASFDGAPLQGPMGDAVANAAKAAAEQSLQKLEQLVVA